MRTDFTRLGPIAPLALLLAAGLLTVQPAAAQTGCAAMVEQFAANRGLSTEPPPVAVPDGTAPGLSGSTQHNEQGSGSGSGTGSERLAQSGGMVAPPAVGDRSVIDPPATGSNMPTAPSVAPQANSRAMPDSGPGGSNGLMGQAARNAQLEALVTAARSAARDGDEGRCLESLNDARRLSQTAPGGQGG
ncbi:hypothetical protein A6A40_10120 [Azospirillum humicireducens]|uniref:Uncharacterized protein n=1 Tax=Azospirillum humicireducens TaxID=1226968 RepID=A0A160JGU9_9PROT|nr:hypothetical protein [Azospirillum humicireducens]ANC92228.1 hypothetical protein A6A40_10120 [Azospirillum humicireducens]